MVYLTKANNKLNLLNIRDAVLDNIRQFSYRGTPFSVEKSTPILISGNPYYELYSLGTFSYDSSFDRVFAFKMARPLSVLSPDIVSVMQEEGFIPNLAVLLGIESANGFDNTPWHKNLSKRRLKEAVSIGHSIRQCKGVEDKVIFVHSLVDNREVIRTAQIID